MSTKNPDDYFEFPTMTKAQQARYEQLLAEHGHDVSQAYLEGIHDATPTVEAVPQEVDGEAVAWRWRIQPDLSWVFTDSAKAASAYKDAGYEVESLYLSAPRVDAQETERLKAAEREACAQVCERASDHIGPDDDDWGNGYIDGSLACASAIRARAALSSEGGEG